MQSIIETAVGLKFAKIILIDLHVVPAKEEGIEVIEVFGDRVGGVELADPLAAGQRPGLADGIESDRPFILLFRPVLIPAPVFSRRAASSRAGLTHGGVLIQGEGPPCIQMGVMEAIADMRRQRELSPPFKRLYQRPDDID